MSCPNFKNHDGLEEFDDMEVFSDENAENAKRIVRMFEGAATSDAIFAVMLALSAIGQTVAASPEVLAATFHNVYSRHLEFQTEDMEVDA